MDQDRANAARVIEMAAGETFISCATSPVVAPLAKSAAIRRFRSVLR
jgi:hypothetical protein